MFHFLCMVLMRRSIFTIDSILELVSFIVLLPVADAYKLNGTENLHVYMLAATEDT